MQDIMPFLIGLRAKYKNSGEWQCLRELLRDLGDLTGSNVWGEASFNDGILLYGAGSIGAGALDYFAEHGVKVLGFLDDTPGREGGEYCGCTIFPISFAQTRQCPVIITVKNWVRPAVRLSGVGLACEAYAHYVAQKNIKQIGLVENEFLIDDQSRLVYLTMLKANLLADYSLYRYLRQGDQYNAIEPFQILNSNDIVIDAGAYVGDSMEEYIWSHHGMFNRIHAFEPNPKLYEALQHRTRRLMAEWALGDGAITCVNAGLGEAEREMPFFELDSGLIAGSFRFAQGKNCGALKIETVDRYLSGSPVTFLKADVEGFEMSLLRGAQETIVAHRPRMALSIYHLMTDMWEIPLYVKSLCPEYKMALRHHSWGHDDTVLYCWV